MKNISVGVGKVLMSINPPSKPLTDFGFQTVPLDEKATYVNRVFTKVAPYYDVMNDIMSLGMHRIWKKLAVFLTHIPNNGVFLDLAGGSGDLTRHVYKKLSPSGQMVIADINPDMLALSKEKFINQGLINNIQWIVADAEALPFSDNTFNTVMIGFGLRNMRDKTVVLANVLRVLKPGGQLMILEFSTPTLPFLKPFYDAYSFYGIPFLGKIFSKDQASYQYLVESIRMHPDQKTLLNLLHQAGFVQAKYYNFSAGIVALHQGYKP
jgi:demethylmenaquinone methyltransferase/2-methoxy-6-polyprenyl-1,4-benzoquinol methylase